MGYARIIGATSFDPGSKVEELYDHRKDQGEHDNLAYLPEASGRRWTITGPCFGNTPR